MFLPRCWARPKGLGTNRMDEIELTGAPLDKVKRRFRRQSTILQGQYPNVNVIMGSTCEAGCKAIVRIQLDQLKADGTLDRLKRPLYVFTGLQFEQQIQPVDGDVIVVGDCAKPVLDRFPDAQYWGECEEYPNCTPDLGQPSRRGHCELRAASGGRSAGEHGEVRHDHTIGRDGARARNAAPPGWIEPDYALRQGILKLLAIKDSDIRLLTLEQCRDAVDQGLHAGGAFSATIPLVALYYGGFLDIDVEDPTRVGPGYVRAQQGPRGRGAGVDLRRARLLRPRRAAQLAIARKHSERTSRPDSAGRTDRHRPDGPGLRRRAGICHRGQTRRRTSIPTA